MVASLLIILISTGLLVYWFRYMCLLILSTQATREYSLEVASENGLHFAELQRVLNQTQGEALTLLASWMERDYRVLNRLLGNSEKPEEANLERVFLAADFAAMGAWFRLTRRFSQTAARRALLERSRIVQHLANSLGEQEAEQSVA